MSDQEEDQGQTRLPDLARLELWTKTESDYPILNSLEPQQTLPTKDAALGPRAKPARVAILCDIVEENWPSMDLVGEMLYQCLQRDHADSFSATRLAPPLRRRLTRVASESRHFFNADLRT